MSSLDTPAQTTLLVEIEVRNVMNRDKAPTANFSENDVKKAKHYKRKVNGSYTYAGFMEMIGKHYDNGIPNCNDLKIRRNCLHD